MSSLRRSDHAGEFPESQPTRSFGSGWFTDMQSDLRYAFRGLRRNPAFALTAIAILGVGIGANTAIFTAVNAALLKPLPYQDPDRLVWITEQVRNNTTDEITLTPDFLEWRARSRSFGALAAFNQMTRNLTQTSEAVTLNAAKASYNLLPALGVNPVLGRGFLREEDARGHDRVAILSHGLWQSGFGGDRGILGRSITLDGQPHVVIGVLPADFQFPASQDVDVITPLAKNEEAELRRGDGVTILRNVIGRLKPGVTLKQAKSELETIQAGLQPPAFLARAKFAIEAVPLHTHLLGDVRRPMLALLGAVGFLLLIACANVANLLLARATSRRREIAIRAAIGVPTFRLVRQFLAESILLAGGGLILAWLLARWARELLLAINPLRMPGLMQVSFDWKVVVFSAACAVLAALIFGLAPGMASLRVSLSEVLNKSSTSAIGGHRQRPFLQIVAAAEIALALVLMMGAGLMLQSFWRLRYASLGFRSDHVLTASLQLSSSHYPDLPRQIEFLDRVLAVLTSLPGVESVAISSRQGLPPGEGRPTNGFGVERRDMMAQGTPPVSHFAVVSGSYFRLLRIPLISGRFLENGDTQLSPLVAVVSHTFVQRYFRDESVIGKRIRTSPRDPWTAIVGVVGDVKTAGLADPPQPVIYRPYAQVGLADANVVARVAVEGGAVAREIRSQIAALDRDQPVGEVQGMDERLTKSVAEPRFAASVLASFGAAALLLAVLGVYGVMACSVNWQTREMGIRRALGAQRANIIGVLLTQASQIIVIGVAVGTLGAFALTRTLGTLLFDISPLDPVTFVSVVGVLVAAVLLGTVLPARRALKVDPTTALRYE